MTKHFIKQKLFSGRSLAAPAQAASSVNSEVLSWPYLNQVCAFETLRAYHGNFFRLPQHLQRLRCSCEGLGKDLPFLLSVIEEFIYEVLRESGWSDAIVRVSVHWKNAQEGILVAMAREFDSHPANWYENGVSLATAVTRRPDLKADNPQIKCSQYVSGVLATIDKGGQTAHELVFLGPSGTVAEGTVSNIFMIKEKRVLTPSAGSGILSGVTRAFVIELCKQRDLKVNQTFLTRHEIYNADECFITNTSSEILPVVGLDGRVIASGRPGPLTKILGSDFKAKLISEVVIHDKN